MRLRRVLPRLIFPPLPVPRVTFIEPNGTRRLVNAPEGLTVMEAARDNGVDIEGACDGSMACSTCHVIVDADWFRRLSPMSEEEEEILDLAYDLRPTSRLGCQIEMSKTLDGLVVSLPVWTPDLLRG